MSAVSTPMGWGGKRDVGERTRRMSWMEKCGRGMMIMVKPGGGGGGQVLDKLDSAWNDSIYTTNTQDEGGRMRERVQKKVPYVGKCRVGGEDLSSRTDR